MKWSTDPLFMFVFGFVAIADGLVAILTLGQVNSHWISRFIFSDFADRLTSKNQK